MDLSLSPDLDAYWCYLVLFTLAFIAALLHVRGLLKGFTNVWAMARSWLLLVAYTAVPVVLFWILDRADALHDTSLFGAVVVAVAYRQILAGSNQSLTPPSGLASAWQPFLAWSDNIAAGIRDRIARNKSRYDAEVVQKIAGKPEVYEKLERLVLNHAPKPGDVQTALADFDKLKPPLDDQGVLERKASFLYFSLQTLPEIDAAAVLRDEKIISVAKYYYYAREWSSRLIVWAVIGILILLVGVGAYQLQTPVYRARYDVWRFEKPNGTAADRARATQRLEEGLRTGKPEYVAAVQGELTAHLRYRAVPLETADRMLKLLFQKTGEVRPGVIQALADSLRTDDADLRVRIEKVLVYLAEERKLTIPAELRDWLPSKEDAPTCVDRAANAWARLDGGGTLEPGALACLGAGGQTQGSAQTEAR